MESNKEVKKRIKKGLWQPEEDLILKNYVEMHGEGNWSNVSAKSGLKRDGKSCRLRWKNYLRPNIKRGGISEEEEDLIIRMHNLLGNRWTLIAGRLPGRTDNAIKNYWNNHLSKKYPDIKRRIIDQNNNNEPIKASKAKRARRIGNFHQICNKNESVSMTNDPVESSKQEKEESIVNDYGLVPDLEGFDYQFDSPILLPALNEPLMTDWDSSVLFESFASICDVKFPEVDHITHVMP